MKYISRIDELKSTTLLNAADRLSRLGHINRSNVIRSYAETTKTKEIEERQAEINRNLITEEEKLKNAAILSTPFKLQIPKEGLSSDKIVVNGVEYTDVEIMYYTNFYLTGLYCTQTEIGYDEFLESNELSFDIVPVFGYVTTETNRPYSKDQKVAIRNAVTQYLEPFNVHVSLNYAIDELTNNSLYVNPDELENDLYRNSTIRNSDSYIPQYNARKLLLTKRSQARLLSTEIKKAMSDDGVIFKLLHKRFKDKDDFDHHVVLSALQKAVMNKLSLNVLYSED